MSHTAPSKFLGNLTGVSFRPAETKLVVYDVLKVGDTFRLERDPTNPHDENAVKVLFDYSHTPTIDEWYGPSRDITPEEEETRLTTSFDDIIFCGFIERGVASPLARWMDEGFVYTAKAKSRIENKMTPWLLEIEPTGEQLPMRALDEERPGGEDDIPY